jgi:hypothetical protein
MKINFKYLFWFLGLSFVIAFWFLPSSGSAIRPDISLDRVYMESWAKALDICHYPTQPEIVGLIASPYWYQHLLIVTDLWIWFDTISQNYLINPDSFDTISASRELCHRINMIHTSFFEGPRAIYMYKGYYLLFNLMAEGMKIISPQVYGILSVQMHAIDTLQLVIN